MLKKSHWNSESRNFQLGNREWKERDIVKFLRLLEKGRVMEEVRESEITERVIAQECGIWCKRKNWAASFSEAVCWIVICTKLKGKKKPVELIGTRTFVCCYYERKFNDFATEQKGSDTYVEAKASYEMERRERNRKHNESMKVTKFRFIDTSVHPMETHLSRAYLWMICVQGSLSGNHNKLDIT